MSYRELEQRVIRIEKQVDQDGLLLQQNQQSLQRNEKLLEAIILELGVLVVDEDVQITGFTLSQKGETKMQTVAGTTSTFNIGLLPADENVPLQSGPTVTVDDTTVTLTAVDSSNNFTATVPLGDTNASYNLTISGVNGAGTPVSTTFNVLIEQPAPPPVQVSGFSLNQLS